MLQNPLGRPFRSTTTTKNVVCNLKACTAKIPIKESMLKRQSYVNDIFHFTCILPTLQPISFAGELLKQADFQVSVNNKQKRIRRVFLFENSIVYSKGIDLIMHPIREQNFKT